MIARILCTLTLPVLLLWHDPTNAESPRAWAYLAWWMPDSWHTAPLEKLERILFFELNVAPSGQVVERHGWPDQWRDLREVARRNDLALDLTLTLFGPKAFVAVFSSTSATQKLLEEAAALAGHPDVGGLHLDFEVYEDVPPATLAAYRRFVRSLAHRLHALTPRRQVSVFFPLGATSDLYDSATLALIDNVVMQGYDAHWKGSARAGPVAPLTGEEAVTWEKGVAKGVSLGVPRSRLLMAFPFYGYEWRVEGPSSRAATRGQGMTTTFAPVPAALLPDIRINVQDRVMQYGARHDPLSGTAYYQFKTAEGQYFEGWFEDWWSLKRKAAFVRREQLGGVAFFILGYDNNALLHYYLAGAP